MGTNLEFSKLLRGAITKVAKEVIAEETRSCFRVKKASVITAPNGSVCEVKLLGDDTVLSLPYSSAVASVSAGDVVWVAIIYNNLKNAVVWQKIDFS